ncbi:MAG: 2Fe-2S iron-sulfur cluster-binding protein [Cyanobacteria bacterium J06597_16]
MTVKVRFMPDGVDTTAKAGEPLLTVAARAGVHISTGCLAGACHACEVEITGEEEPTLACLRSIPEGVEALEITMFDDPTW